MIDLGRDLHWTEQDLLNQERVRRQRQGLLSLDEYMDFLDSLQTLFPRLAQRRSRKPAWALPLEPFELLQDPGRAVGVWSPPPRDEETPDPAFTPYPVTWAR